MFDLSKLADMSKLAEQAKQAQERQECVQQEQLNLLRQIANKLDGILSALNEKN